MRFEPQPNDSLRIGKERFKVSPHPAVPRMAFGQEGRKSIVYQLRRTSDGRLYALKTFKLAFRGPYVIDVAKRIAGYAALPGMEACERTILTKSKHGAVTKKYPDLEYAVLMPWVAGQTWHDTILKQEPLSRGQSLILASVSAEILSTLEEKGLAHCDIASGNVLISIKDGHVGLVDLEDLYGPNMSAPADCPSGTDGYQHRTSRTRPQGQWCAEGDRFSGAILMAEILAWHDPGIPKRAYAACFFRETEMQELTCDRYALILDVLRATSADAADLFQRAWSSPTMADCPTLREWAEVVTAQAKTQRALFALEEEIDSGSDRRIFSTWQQHETILDGLPEAQDHRSRVDLAHERCNALDQLRDALASNSIARVLTIYTDHQSLLEPCQDFEPDERERVEPLVHLHAALRQALYDNDDLEIARAYTATDLDWSGLLTKKEEARVDLAIRRWDGYKYLEVALQNDSDEDIVAVCDHYERQFAGFALVELDPRVSLAKGRVPALRELRAALRDGDHEAIWKVYGRHGNLLKECKDITSDERSLVEETRDSVLHIKTEALLSGLWTDDDLKIEGAYDAVLFQNTDTLDQDDQTRVDLAIARVEALSNLQSALQSGNPAAIVQVYDDHADLLRYCSGFTATERLSVADARRALLLNNLWKAMQSGDDRETVSAAEQALARGADLDPSTIQDLQAARWRLATRRHPQEHAMGIAQEG